MSNSVRPHRWQPMKLPRPWDSPGKNTGMGCHFLLQCMKVKSESEDAQSYSTRSDPMDCSLPGSSVHGIFQARVLEWGAIKSTLKLLAWDWLGVSNILHLPLQKDFMAKSVTNLNILPLFYSQLPFFLLTSGDWLLADWNWKLLLLPKSWKEIKGICRRRITKLNTKD